MLFYLIYFLEVKY